MAYAAKNRLILFLGLAIVCINVRKISDGVLWCLSGELKRISGVKILANIFVLLLYYSFDFYMGANTNPQIQNRNFSYIYAKTALSDCLKV